MTVATSATSESHTGTTGSTNQASFSWTHAGNSGVNGVIVFVFTISATDTVTSVVYNNVTLTRVPGGSAIDNATEPGRVDLFFLGTGVSSTGNVTITVNRTNNATTMYAVAMTFLSLNTYRDQELAGLLTLQNDQVPSVQNIDDGSTSGVSSVRVAGAYTGAASPAGPGTGSTAVGSIDLGAFGCSTVRETTAGIGSRPVGFTGTSDDYAAVYVAVREVVKRRIALTT